MFAAFLEIYAETEVEADDVEYEDFEIEADPPNVELNSTSVDQAAESGTLMELEKVKTLFEKSLIDEDEYKALKQKILGL